MDRRHIRFTLFFSLLLAILPAISSRKSFALISSGESPLWWDISILLKTEGEYRIEDAAANYSGTYSFAFLWEGTMERDNGDYLLYSQNTKLLDWKAEESVSSLRFKYSLTADDFSEKPSFDLKYILRKETGLHIDFIVEGFAVPQNESSESFLLHLPSSEENNQQHSEITYNSFVTEGSNRIRVEESEIYRRKISRHFSWRWKNQKWFLRQQKTLFVSHGHRVHVEISITPRH